MSEQLEPCPHCGGMNAICLPASEIEQRDDDGMNDECFAVVCDIERGGCGATGGYRATKAEAIAAWKPAPAQAREDEVLANKLASLLPRQATYCQMPPGVWDSAKAAEMIIAALRSRQSPQVDDDATTCLACGQHNTAPGYLCPACGRPYLDHEHVADKLLDAAAPQPSPPACGIPLTSHPALAAGYHWASHGPERCGCDSATEPGNWWNHVAPQPSPKHDDGLVEISEHGSDCDCDSCRDIAAFDVAGFMGTKKPSPQGEDADLVTEVRQLVGKMDDGYWPSMVLENIEASILRIVRTRLASSPAPSDSEVAEAVAFGLVESPAPEAPK